MPIGTIPIGTITPTSTFHRLTDQVGAMAIPFGATHLPTAIQDIGILFPPIIMAGPLLFTT
jgi:hypothetical protein